MPTNVESLAEFNRRSGSVEALRQFFGDRGSPSGPRRGSQAESAAGSSGSKCGRAPALSQVGSAVGSRRPSVGSVPRSVMGQSISLPIIQEQLSTRAVPFAVAVAMAKPKKAGGDPCRALRMSPLSWGFDCSNMRSEARVVMELATAKAMDPKWSTEIKEVDHAMGANIIRVNRTSASIPGQQIPDVADRARREIKIADRERAMAELGRRKLAEVLD